MEVYVYHQFLLMKDKGLLEKLKKVFDYKYLEFKFISNDDSRSEKL